MRYTQTQICAAETSSESSWSDAGKFSQKVRELAHRADRVLNASAQADASVQEVFENVARDQRDLYDPTCRLQRQIHGCGLNALITGVDTLHRQVQGTLDLARKAGAR
jgi:hypothetical protein